MSSGGNSQNVDYINIDVDSCRRLKGVGRSNLVGQGPQVQNILLSQFHI